LFCVYILFAKNKKKIKKEKEKEERRRGGGGGGGMANQGDNDTMRMFSLRLLEAANLIRVNFSNKPDKIKNKKIKNKKKSKGA
jgi:hypothetical protein